MPVTLVEIVKIGVLPPEDEPAKPFAEAIEIALTEPEAAGTQVKTPVPSFERVYPEEAACAVGQTIEYEVTVAGAVNSIFPEVLPFNCKGPPSVKTLFILEKSMVWDLPLTRLKSLL